jgi:hypothetical protein
MIWPPSGPNSWSRRNQGNDGVAWHAVLTPLFGSIEKLAGTACDLAVCRHSSTTSIA